MIAATSLYRRIIPYVVIVALGVALDLWTKSVMFSWPALNNHMTYWVWPEYFGFQRSLNEGAVFGIGQGMVWYFAAVSFIALCAIPLWLFKFGAASDFWVTVALAAITAGVIGNLFDRLGLPGLDWGILYEQREGEAVYAVRDWILFQINDQWRWPNFNLADSYLVCGAAVAMLRTLWVPDSSTNSAG